MVGGLHFVGDINRRHHYDVFCVDLWGLADTR